jgi:hypothetical protein
MIGVGGAFGLTFALYWVWLFGLPFLIGQLQDGNLIAIAWAAISFISAGSLLRGINEARSHDDERSGGEVVASLLFGGLSGWALWHHWFLDSTGWAFHLSRAFWLSCMGAMAFNLWLNFRKVQRQRRVAVPQPVRPARPSLPLTQRIVRRVRLTRSGDGEWTEARELYGNNHALPEQFFPPVIGSDGRPVQIVYVQNEETGEFIAVELPKDRVHVTKRLR